jgi:hypothetical protein
MALEAEARSARLQAQVAVLSFDAEAPPEEAWEHHATQDLLRGVHVAEA